MTCQFTQPMIIPVAERTYRLEQEYQYCWLKDGINNRMLIPTGFTYDGASVPRFIWSLSGITPDGLIRAAALVHDWIYNHAGLLPPGFQQYLQEDQWLDVHGRWSRREADRMFSRIMRDAGVSRFRRRIAYLAVRLFGWFSWNC